MLVSPGKGCSWLSTGLQGEGLRLDCSLWRCAIMKYHCVELEKTQLQSATSRNKTFTSTSTCRDLNSLVKVSCLFSLYNPDSDSNHIKLTFAQNATVTGEFLSLLSEVAVGVHYVTLVKCPDCSKSYLSFPFLCIIDEGWYHTQVSVCSPRLHVPLKPPTAFGRS